MDILNEHYFKLLCLETPWEVSAVDLSLENQEVKIQVLFPKGQKVTCPVCEKNCSIADHAPMRTWRHLDTMQFETLLQARVPRSNCRACGVKTIAIPWAGPHSRFTLLFEAFVIEILLVSSSVERARSFLKLDWNSVQRIMDRAVERGLSKRKTDSLEYVGLDEKSFGKGQDYISVLYDIGESRVLEVKKDRTQESAEQLLESIPEPDRKNIEAVSIDMWKAFENAILEKLPEAEIVHDRFHISKHLNEAVDKVRCEEHQILTKQGDETLKNSRYLWLYNEENLDEKHHKQFKLIKDLTLKTSRAWGIKELFREFWDYKGKAWARKFFKKWYAWASHSQLTPIVKVGKMIKDHLENILTFFEHRITNATAEGFNSKIQAIKAAARGFRRFENYRTRILFFCGKLDLTPKVAH